MMNLTNEDNMELMARYPDKYFELAIIDPPYGIGADKPSNKPTYVVQKNGNKLPIDSNKYEHKNWDNNIPDKSFFDEVFRVSKNQIIWGGNYFGLSGGYICWDKLNGDSDQFGCELAWQSFNNRTDVVYFMWQGMFQGIYCGKDVKKALLQQGNKNLNEKRFHPTQKPVALYKWLLTNYAKKGDKIIDTNIGAGSIAIACHDLGFDLTGCELDTAYFNAMMKRLDDHKKQLKIF
jgi:site-specific DNA-methyltransferase (adenine-specific)